MRNLVTGGLILISAMCAPIAEGAKIYQLVNARVYHKDGAVSEYGGDSMLSIPRKKDALQPVEKAYTNRYCIKPGLFLLGKKEEEELIVHKEAKKAAVRLDKEMIVML